MTASAPEQLRRPRVICHMMTSLNSRITGDFMTSAWAEPAHALYNSIHDEMAVDAWMNGRATTEEAFTDGRSPALQPLRRSIDRVDSVVAPAATSYFVSVDPSGKVGWQQSHIDYAGRPPAHIIEVLTEDVDDRYLSLLQDLGISYIFGGVHHLNFPLTLRKLAEKFGIQRLALEGGGSLNASLIAEDCIDELSLLLVPAVDSNQQGVPLFGLDAGNPASAVRGFELLSANRRDGDVLHLVYQRSAIS